MPLSENNRESVRFGHPSFTGLHFLKTCPIFQDSLQKSVNYFWGNMKDAKI